MTTTGERAEDFALTGTQGEEIQTFRASEFADGRPLLLAFYIYDFSPVCTDQMCEINDMELLTVNDDVAVLGVSPDGPYSHKRFIDEEDISYPLLYDPDLRVYDRFEFTRDENPSHKRGIVLLDADFTVRYRWEASDDEHHEWSVGTLNEANGVARELVSGTD